MHRFDSELELESHELGRSLLFMVRDAGAEIEGLPRHVPLPTPPNPFEAMRERLAAAGTAIHDLHHKVLLVSCLHCALRVSSFLSTAVIVPESLGLKVAIPKFSKPQLYSNKL